MNDLPNLRQLAPEGLRPDGEVRPCYLPLVNAVDVLPAAARVRETQAGGSGRKAGAGSMGKKTVIVVEIHHDKPLPEGITDICAERAYNWLTNKGVRCDVVAVRHDVNLLRVVDQGEPCPMRVEAEHG